MDKLIDKIKGNGKTIYLLNDDEINELANITKEVAIGFAEFLLADFEMGVFEDGRDEDLCWVLGGTNQKSTTPELFDIYLESIK